ncbi:hypothetical protein GYMLUDRAFT_77908 [Collybiopsis luxurians FD-317 M1]|uniref:Uncharacterized protein n=1 Tax=Collybiopsis luxurians FD-317 M1 TaxID=944289 RepID=A0A0D0C340_9AGAR|nr:hypothetical protein GYMLUDRAFT_77908 [Collybiopsis luxurians FD-317 M1]
MLAAEGTEMEYDDIWCRKNVLDFVERVEMTHNNVVVSLSLDGAQLYQNKQSNCWISIWIPQDYSSNCCFKKKNILLNVTIPGPNKPKHTDSFLFPGLHHLTLLFRKRMTARGRHKPNSGHYYSAHAHPYNVSVLDNNHDDVDIETLEFQTLDEYKGNLTTLQSSADSMEYKCNHKDTGLSKSSILSGLNSHLSLPIPACFGLNLMHLLCLNIEDLFLCLWCGTLKCKPMDNKMTWAWVKLVGQTWEEHGEIVANATQYFLSSFQCPPHNPAKKLSSGYKATEYKAFILCGKTCGLVNRSLE